MSCCILTPQEEWIAEGKIPDCEGRSRVLELNEKIRNEPIRLDINRARLFTESMKTTEGMDLSIRWAKALMHIAENFPVSIVENELLVGKPGNKLGRYGFIYPETDGPYLLDVEHSAQREVSPFLVDPEDMEILRNEIYPYWKDKSFAEAYAKALPEETRHLIFGEDPTNFSKQQFVVAPTITARSSLNYNFDIERVLKKGLGELQNEAKENLEKVKVDPAKYVSEGPFWEAGYLGLCALSKFIDRYAKEAQHLCEIEKNPARKKELEVLADVCNWITTKPARDFHTALQLQWFMAMFLRIEQNVGGAMGTARMDQHLYPYYKNDLDRGALSREQAKELLECYWLNLSQIPILQVADGNSKIFEAYAHFETVTIGGQTPNGEDATNDLSYLILESKRGLPIPYPDLAARVHTGTPERFLKKCAEVIKEGQGFPKLLNDEEIVPLYLAKGATLEEARDYAVSGCTETRLVNKETYINGCALVNLGALVELVMNNGRLKILGNKKVGLETGDPRYFKDFEEFFEAFKKQYEYLIRQAIIQQTVGGEVKPTKLRAPLSSIFVGKCREYSKDLNMDVPNSFKEMFIEKVGYGTLIDSLVAIKKLVYEEKKFTMNQLIQALDSNFEGFEAMRSMLQHAPKYGNADPYADKLGKKIDKVCLDYVSTHQGLYGEIISDRIVPVTNHIPAGKVVGATPDGRKAGDYLSEGTSASHGAELGGPTATLISNKAVKNEGYKERAARLLNIKLSPSSLSGEEGTKKLIDFIRTWCDLRIWHVQFNVINKNTLLAAQKDPDKYRDLIVRVAGYSAYFNDLSPMLQKELIERTEEAI